MLKEYDAVIQEQLQKGIIEKVASLEETDKYIMYPFGITHRQAEMTKLRVVYDASAREGVKGMSLNDCLHVRPSLNPLLFNILVRFREKRTTLVADIEKAFLNIDIDKQTDIALDSFGQEI